MHAPALYLPPVHFPIPSIPYSQPTYFPYLSSQLEMLRFGSVQNGPVRVLKASEP